jgi:hypothetical protein
MVCLENDQFHQCEDGHGQSICKESKATTTKKKGQLSQHLEPPTCPVNSTKKVFDYKKLPDNCFECNTVKQLADKFVATNENDNITMFDFYGALDVSTTRDLFKDILSRNRKAIILLCGSQVVDLYSPRVATKEWEERVLIEDFN